MKDDNMNIEEQKKRERTTKHIDTRVQKYM